MKNLSLVVMFMLLFVACSDDDDSWSAKDLEGKWSIYEFVEDGETEEVSLKTELSYFELKSNKDYEALIIMIIVRRSYSLSGDELTVTIGNNTELVKVLDVKSDKAVVEMEEDGKKFIANLKRTTVEPQLFLEPVLDFNADSKSIKQKERRVLSEEKTDNLTFRSSNKFEKNLLYTFENGKMIGAMVLLNLYSISAEALVDYM
ncbi:MAG: hypothetical protein ACLUDU_11645, partial [Butyricimonas faecihominis]